MESIRDKAVIIKHEAKAIEDILDEYNGLDSLYAIEKCLKQINETTTSGIEQIRNLQGRFNDTHKGNRKRRI